MCIRDRPYTTSADTSVSGYNGLSGAEVDWDTYDDLADGVYIPLVQTNGGPGGAWDTRVTAVSYTHLRAHETVLDLVCRLLLEKKNNTLYN